MTPVLLLGVLSTLSPIAAQEIPADGSITSARSAVRALAMGKRPDVISRSHVGAPRTAMDRVSQLANHMDRDRRAVPPLVGANRVFPTALSPYTAHRAPFSYGPRVFPGSGLGYYGAFGYPYSCRYGTGGYGYGYGCGVTYVYPGCGFGGFGVSISAPVTIWYDDPLGRQWRMVDEGVRRFAAGVPQNMPRW